MDYDAIVVGGGHAGIEASLALSRMGFETLLVTQSLDTIGRLSCNPAVGGLAKGNLVREVDALGGEMAHLIDRSMIQYRILNRRRGPAVQAPRAQADKFTYSRLAKETLEGQSHLKLFMDTVVDITEDDHHRFVGVVTQRGHRITAKVMVLTTGTFMEGKIFIGEYDAPCGRLNEQAAIGLGTALRNKGFDVGRLKTGTPARVRKSSLDLDAMERQDADEKIMPFSFDYDVVDRPMVPCYITWTNERTHAIIRENIHRSPLYGGKIVGKGPRYCPSIEDKVVRFPQRERHQVFIEPEGLGTEEMYLNGLSSSLPEDVQDDFIHSVKGLEKAEIMRPAYAVEYDFLNPKGLYPSLESKRMEGLFVAGQTNGTSGYEEAACQGLMAGINAAQKLRGAGPLILKRNEAYIGVLIDDLVTMGTTEPYRMFTSRAEYRLHLGHDTSDQRLTRKGFDVGLQKEEALERLKQKVSDIEAVKELLRQHGYQQKNAYEALRNPDVSISDMIGAIPELASFREPIRYQTELEVKYQGYIDKEDREIERFEKLENLAIPQNFSYDDVMGLSSEGREKLTSVGPASVGQASRINGVRMSDLALLILHLKKGKDMGKPINSELLGKCLSMLHLSFSEEQVGQLVRYYGLLERYNPTLKMVKAEGDDFIVRHFADSLSGLPTLSNLASGYKDPAVADMGSGAGLPGIPLAIGMPSCRFSLIERMEKRADFLEFAIKACALRNVDVVCRRLCEVDRQYEIITCRAFHPFYDIEDEIDPILKRGGVVMLYKGREEVFKEELSHLKRPWEFTTVKLSVPFLDAERSLCVGRRD